MRKVFLSLAILFAAVPVLATQRENLWPKNKMPDAQPHQVAEMRSVTREPGFNPDKHRMPYLEWFDAPADSLRNGCCMILISGGAYKSTCDEKWIVKWNDWFTKLGVQCVNFVYRTPRPEGLPIYQTAWEDGQRAVRKVRSEAAKRGFDPEKIGVIGMSAGSHLGLMLATSSLTRAYAPVDALDSIPCHINWAILNSPAYVVSDGELGANTFQGYGPGVELSKCFKFDAKTCPVSFHHGGLDPYSPNGTTQAYRQLRRMGIPAELHLVPDLKHKPSGFERAVEFMTQMGWMGELKPEEKLSKRFADDSACDTVIVEKIWAGRKIPNYDEKQGEPYIEWYIPRELKTKAIQIIYSGGSYKNNGTNSFEVAPFRRFLNSKGMAVVTMRYRTPRPEGLPKHISAQQDLQRAIKLVRTEAASRGLDPDRIGIMGSSAGGHLTLLGVTSSAKPVYVLKDKDKIDQTPCNVQWGIAIYPAYALTDGVDKHNTTGGNDDSAVLVPELIFDLNTVPTLFIHGDADGWAAMNSVKCWEKMRAMGVQSELHTLATRKHCFQRTASPGTGSYTVMDRVWEFLTAKGYNK